MRRAAARTASSVGKERIRQHGQEAPDQRRFRPIKRWHNRCAHGRRARLLKRAPALRRRPGDRCVDPEARTGAAILWLTEGLAEHLAPYSLCRGAGWAHLDFEHAACGATLAPCPRRGLRSLDPQTSFSTAYARHRRTT